MAQAQIIDLAERRKRMAKQQQQKKMEFKPVDFDVNEIPPDAPPGEWSCTIPRGQCKIQPTKDDHFPMVVVPVRLDGTEEDDDAHQRALGTVLSAFLVFGGKNSRAERMSKLRIRQFCEAIDFDLDDLPTKLTDPENDLQPFVRAIEGKKFTAWTRVSTRRDTGEEVTDLLFYDPKALKGAAPSDKDDDEGDDDADEEKATKGKGKADKGKKGKKR